MDLRNPRLDMMEVVVERTDPTYPVSNIQLDKVSEVALNKGSMFHQSSGGMNSSL